MDANPPVNAQKLKELADLIKKEIPGLGFSLVVFSFGDQIRPFNYISNAQREDMIGTFEALLTKWKNQRADHN